MTGAIDAMRAKLRAEAEHTDQHGAVKGILSADFNGRRLVAVGSTLHLVDAQCFPDFLTTYLIRLLWTEAEWGMEQRKEVADRHPAYHWDDVMTRHVSAVAERIGDVVPTKVGAAHAWLRLAYDLYLIAHNAVLQDRLIERLRDPRSFQGARFETAVAAMMLAAGYDLAFVDDSGRNKGPRVEFVATPKEGGPQLAVEAKSRHRPGVMQSLRGGQLKAPAECQLGGLIEAALAKGPALPLLIFIEANVPAALTQAKHYTQEIENSWDIARRDVPPNQFPAIGAVFYNDVSPWKLEEDVPNDGFIWCQGLYSENRHHIDARHLIDRIALGVMQRTRVPQAFPDDAHH